MSSTTVEVDFVDSADETNPEFSPAKAPTSGEWSTWLKEVSAMASRMTRDGETALELTQEALIQLLRSRRPIWSVTAWARTVMCHLLMRIETRRRAERSRTRTLSTSLSATHLAGPETSILVSEILGRIPELHRRPLLLAAAGLSHLEISAKLGCRVNQVGPRLARAHQAARRLLSLARDPEKNSLPPE